MFQVTLTYKDGTKWFAGGFETRAEAEAWIDSEKQKSYWDAETTASIVDTSPTGV